MARETYVMRAGRLVPKRLAAPLHAPDAAPYVIGDDLPGGGCVHPSTGKMMDSKSKFRAETRARGLVEVGNDVRLPRRPIDIGSPRDDIRRAISELGGGS